MSMETSTMTASVDDLLTVESRFDRTFAVALVAILAYLFWPLAARTMGVTQYGWASIVDWVSWVLLLAAYVWFALAASAAARHVGRSPILIGAWILLAPIVGPVAGALVPIPFLGTLIAVSPLSLRFLLAGELRSEIQKRTLA
jgi:hypothetical protein